MWRDSHIYKYGGQLLLLLYKDLVETPMSVPAPSPIPDGWSFKDGVYTRCVCSLSGNQSVLFIDVQTPHRLRTLDVHQVSC